MMQYILSMKAARFIGPGSIEVREEDIPAPTSDELLIQVKSAGLCGTDLHIFDGSNTGLVTPGTVLGHEFAGIVAEIGKGVKGFEKGDRVAIEPNLFCGHCYYCRTARKHFCENWSAIGLSRDGGFQEYCAIPASAAYKFSETINFPTAALFEPLSCVLHGLERSKLKAGESVLLQGAGGIGQLFLKILSKMGLNDIIVSDIDSDKLAIAKSNGATHIINVQQEDLIHFVHKITNGYGVNVMIDAAGLTSTITDSLSLLENTGRVLIFGVPSEKQKAEIVPYQIYKKEIEIIGSYTNPYSNEASIRLLKRLNLVDIVTHSITLENIVEQGLNV
ncbi:MAG: zinc-dependent alcohol dehydrogenase family protein, partial [Candidatus Thorarchaeota archaeon]